ncbi:hypothetical protein [Glycomyces terrestris]|uniref:hypothetical protein n=1 Tax=Glycomyces terrestris TaxID=2493553 RepID=UPI0013154F2C|nr:hypothetical protein [Glycomyces terrestris]
MTSNEQRILVIGERRAQLNTRALADLLVTAAQTELPPEDDHGPRPPTRIKRPNK